MILTETVSNTNIAWASPVEWADLGTNAAMFIVALVSAICAFLAYRHQRDRSKKEGACKLAEYYANVILEEHGFISNVYRAIGLDSYIRSTIDINVVHDFDDVELNEILTEKRVDRNEFLRKISDIDANYILKCRLARARAASDRLSTWEEFVETDSKTGQERIKNEVYLKMDLHQDITDLLNQLEYFCMNCRYGLADEEILYQSLHQTFISLVWILYPTISRRNTSNEDKLYTNVIWLFLKWRDRLSEIKEKAQKEREAMERKAEAAKVKAEKKHEKASRAQNKADKVAEKAKATKAKVFNGKPLK